MQKDKESICVSRLIVLMKICFFLCCKSHGENSRGGAGGDLLDETPTLRRKVVVTGTDQ